MARGAAQWWRSVGRSVLGAATEGGRYIRRVDSRIGHLLVDIFSDIGHLLVDTLFTRAVSRRGGEVLVVRGGEVLVCDAGASGAR